LSDEIQFNRPYRNRFVLLVLHEDYHLPIGHHEQVNRFPWVAVMFDFFAAPDF